MDTRVKKTLKLLTHSAIFAALIFLATSYLSIPLPVMGYVHLGDGLVLLAAALLPAPYAVGAAVIGAGIADLMAGYALYLPATVIIKALTVICVSSKTKKVICLRNAVAMVPAAVLCAGGYYLFEVIISNNFVSPIASIPFNLVQSVCGATVFLLLGFLIDKNPGLAKIFKKNLQ